MRLWKSRVGLVLLGAVATMPMVVAVAAADTPTYQEEYRPQFHYTQGQGFVNDPNGLVYYQGEYHMFYQDRQACGQAWGHAISRDLVHWTELGIAIPCEGTERIFSGSIVIDKDNTSGFGTAENPPMVAIYTSARPGNQSQSLAFSLDRGRTWTKYEVNPVLDIGSGSFRDPKVFWHEETQRWIMPIALSSLRQIAFYSSANLKDWTFESHFGPLGAVTGEYEVPDVFPLTVEETGEEKWVMLVNINPGAINGGSALQYFVGEFDGHEFTQENVQPYSSPAGAVNVADFEATGYGSWTTTGTAFGTGPTAGALTGQAAIVGYEGDRLVNSRQPAASAVGTLTSPPFEITKGYINFLVGGADAPLLPGSSAEATVNLVVDGERVRTATGDNSNWLDWNAWNVEELVGRTARIEAVDTLTTGNQGSILLDQVTFADGPALSGQDRTDWADWGRDFYAAITFDNVPDDRRLMVGWMSNWQYTRDVPTSPWQSAQSEPRELSLRQIDGEPQLVQQPVDELASLRHSVDTTRVAMLNDRERTLDARGKALDIELELDMQTADRAGIKVLTGNGEETVIGYDAVRQELFVDRTRSGNVDFHPRFASISRAPLELPRGQRLKLRILVDHMLVEVFADQGRRVFTETVFPGMDSDGVELFAEGGRAAVRNLNVWQMRSIWFPNG
jgi:sucrose-6-phosphate hydrolase SacC (GH32 family)